jgi:hypothetical protein
MMRPFSKCATKYSLGMAVALLLCFVPPPTTHAVAATSDDLFDRYFAGILDGLPCFARTYEEAHLNAHSTQRVRSIEIDLTRTNSDGTPNAADHFELGFALMLKTSAEWYGQAASCKTGDDAFECFLEGDGGVFRLTPLDNGGLRLETGDNGISLEGASDAVELSGKSGDDRAFDLAPSKQECEDARAFFAGSGD